MRVVVIGGGAVGSAVALFLKRLGGAAVHVQVVEPDPGLALASSARSAASIRQQFSNPVNVQMSQFGLEVISQADAWLGVAGAPVDLGLVRSGYLFCATAAGAPLLQARHAVQRTCGADVALLAPAEAAARFPWLRTDDLALASLGLSGEGWFDGEAFARALAAQARALGALWQRGRVVAFDRSPGAAGGAGKGQRTGQGDGRLLAAVLDNGSRIEADAYVNAAGPWAGAVAALAGLAVPVFARRRTVFVMRCPTPITPPGQPTPLVVDPAGIWFRSEGAGFIGGWSPGGGQPDTDDLPLDQPDLQQFEDHLWPAMAHRVPAFEALRVQRAWAGYYEVHPLDHNALIGPHPDCANLLLCNGFSGHGLQHAPAAGRGLAEWLLTGQWQTLDLSAFSPQRVLTGRGFVEQAII